MNGVDSIAVKMAAGYNMMRPLEWQALAQQERFDLVKAHRVVFLCEGQSVPVREALAWLSAHVAVER